MLVCLLVSHSLYLCTLLDHTVDIWVCPLQLGAVQHAAVDVVPPGPGAAPRLPRRHRRRGANDPGLAQTENDQGWKLF